MWLILAATFSLKIGKLFALFQVLPGHERWTIMIDFILAGILYLLLMFIAFSLLSFVTIGLTYTVVVGLKRFLYLFRQPGLALK
jgi:hypothetical protein